MVKSFLEILRRQEDSFLSDMICYAQHVEPHIIKQQEPYYFLFKPEQMHTLAQGQGQTQSLASWFSGTQSAQKKVGKDGDAGICHRLDFATSGLVVAAANQIAYEFLRNLFSKGRVTKHYVCLLKRDVPLGVHTAYLGGRYRGSKKVKLTKHKFNRSTLVQTEILESVKQDDGLYRVKINLITGARHQIRSHLAFLGSPLIGDSIYGGEVAPRLMLHASEIRFTGDDGQLYFADCPEPFADAQNH